MLIWGLDCVPRNLNIKAFLQKLKLIALLKNYKMLTMYSEKHSFSFNISFSLILVFLIYYSFYRTHFEQLNFLMLKCPYLRQHVFFSRHSSLVQNLFLIIWNPSLSYDLTIIVYFGATYLVKEILIRNLKPHKFK